MSFYLRLAHLYMRLRRVPLLGPFLDWLKLRLFSLGFNRLDPAYPQLGESLRRQVETQAVLLDGLSHALAGLRAWSEEQAHQTHALQERIDAQVHQSHVLQEQIDVHAHQTQELQGRTDALTAQDQGLLDRLVTLEGYLTGNTDEEGIWPRLERLGTAHHSATERMEFVRSEILFELQKVARLPPPQAPGSGVPAPVTPYILNPAKLEANQDLRLNLGCGHITQAERINVDRRELPGVDVVADVADLPFPPGSLAEIYAAHLLEHFPERYLLDRLLPHWRQLLRPQGELRLVIPDALAMLDAYRDGRLSFADLRLITFGAQDYDGDFHYTMLSPESLTALLQQAGFQDIHIIERNRPNGLCLEMELSARP